MNDAPEARTSRVRARVVLVVFSWVALAVSSARADIVLPGQGVTSGGGNSFAGTSWLTSAAGQAGAGRATGGGFVEFAGWLRWPSSGNVGVSPTPPPASAPELSVRPNPVAAEAVFSVRLPPSSEAAGALPAEVRIHDVAGRLLRVLRTEPVAGEQSLRWDGRDVHGVRAQPGIYLVRLRIGGLTLTRRLVLTH